MSADDKTTNTPEYKALEAVVADFADRVIPKMVHVMPRAIDDDAIGLRLTDWLYRQVDELTPDVRDALILALCSNIAATTLTVFDGKWRGLVR
jgi:hypothetical protein